MTKNSARILLFLILLWFPNLTAQIVYENLNNDVYIFLERLNQKGIIEYFDLIKPLSRKYISEKLIEAEKNISLLTELDKQELEYYKKDFYFELESFREENSDKKYLRYFESDQNDRFRFFSYNDRLFKFTAEPLLGFDLSYQNGEKTTHSWMGITAYSYLIDNIGVNVYFKTNNEKGDVIDVQRDFTPETGIIPEVHDYGRDIAYTEVRSSISLDWEWGDVIVAKDFLKYGYQKFGNLVLSDKAPSFPYVRIDLKPVDWFNFTFFHAWLSSLVVDSIKLEEYNRDIYRDKYFAWHALTITPFTGFNFTLGESVIYSDRVEPIYLMPFMFYYLADEYISSRRAKPGDANQQIFLTLSSQNHLPKTRLFATLFIDELTIGGINGSLFINTTYGGATQRRQRTQLGFTLGASVVDFPINNLSTSMEYTRINPFVYGHHDTAQTYTNSGYVMGHWMGHNSDLFYFDINYRFFRGLEATVWGSYLRKGSDDYSRQYIQPEPDFLFGLRTNYKYFGLNLKYELMHELGIETKFKLTNISAEQDDGSFLDDNFEEFSFSLYYGL